jgi:septin 7
MSDSYTTRAIDLSPNGFPNGSSPSLVPTHTSGISSVIRKKLMGYVGFANLPNQVHRKSVRKGFQFTAMVVGMSFPPFLGCNTYAFSFTQASLVWGSLL